MRGRALFDPTGTYRYRLSRRWASGRRVAFVLLNPNTADAAHDDPTIRRCVGFARRWGFGSLAVVNLFAYRTRDPHALVRASDPVGPDNDRHLARAVRRADLVVCGWGASPLARDRAATVLGIVRRARDLAAKPGRAEGSGTATRGPAALYCLGRTRSGMPRHPLYLRASTPRVRFSGP